MCQQLNLWRETSATPLARELSANHEHAFLLELKGEIYGHLVLSKTIYQFPLSSTWLWYFKSERPRLFGNSKISFLFYGHTAKAMVNEA